MRVATYPPERGFDGPGSADGVAVAGRRRMTRTSTAEGSWRGAGPAEAALGAGVRCAPAGLPEGTEVAGLAAGVGTWGAGVGAAGSVSASRSRLAGTTR